MKKNTACVGCSRVVCESGQKDLALPECPMQTDPALIDEMRQLYDKPGTHEFAKQAAIQGYECFVKLEDGRTPVKTRIQETVEFAEKMGYKKLGLAFCGGLRNEAKIINQVLLKHGFEVVSVCCKVGGYSSEILGIAPEKNNAPYAHFPSMCNPLTQAEILNRAKTELNIMVGLCVGHDALFLQRAKAPTTVLIVKDRVLGNNPAAALYTSGKYYCKLL